MLKLHKQFGHCSARRLLDLLKKSGENSKDVIDLVNEVTKNCDVCASFDKPSPRPIVTMPLSETFNDTIAIDLHALSSQPYKWYVHIIDLHTRFSEAALVSFKSSNTMVYVL